MEMLGPHTKSSHPFSCFVSPQYPIGNSSLDSTNSFSASSPLVPPPPPDSSPAFFPMALDGLSNAVSCRVSCPEEKDVFSLKDCDLGASRKWLLFSFPESKSRLLIFVSDTFGLEEAATELLDTVDMEGVGFDFREGVDARELLTGVPAGGSESVDEAALFVSGGCSNFRTLQRCLFEEERANMLSLVEQDGGTNLRPTMFSPCKQNLMWAVTMYMYM